MEMESESTGLGKVESKVHRQIFDEELSDNELFKQMKKIKSTFITKLDDEDSKQKESNDHGLSDILMSNREYLYKYLTERGTYKKIKSDMKKIEKEYSTEKRLNILEELCLSDDSNNSIVEMPTVELLRTIQFLCNVFDIHTISELYARSGILSCMINNMFKNENNENIEINAYDNTGGMYYKTEPYTRETIEAMDYNTLLILNWPDLHNRNNYLELLTNKRFANVIIIDNQSNSYVNDNFLIKMRDAGYTYIPLYVKQLCCYDYFEKNAWYEKNTSVSMMHLFTCSRLELAMEFIFDGIGNETFNMPRDSRTLRQLFQDFAIQGKIPLWICNIENDNEFMMIVSLYKKMCENLDNANIPYWIWNVKSFKFWCLCVHNNTLPRKLKRNKKLFEKFMRKILGLPNKGLVEYKRRKIIPEYIKTLRDAEKYIFLTYLTDNTRYLDNYDDFVILFNDSWIEYLNDSA
jgi:hypothetical protein